MQTRRARQRDRREGRAPCALGAPPRRRGPPAELARETFDVGPGPGQVGLVPDRADPGLELQLGIAQRPRQVEGARPVRGGALPGLVADHPGATDAHEQEPHGRRVVALAEVGQDVPGELDGVGEPELLREDRADEGGGPRGLLARAVPARAGRPSEERQRLRRRFQAGVHVRGERDRPREAEDAPRS